jgi:putative membrane protein
MPAHRSHELGRKLIYLKASNASSIENICRKPRRTEVNYMLALLMDVAYDCGHGFTRWGTGGWIWMGLMMLAGLVVIATVVYLLFKGFSSSEKRGAYFSAAYKETPLEIARRRYAAGEINQEEFERIKKDLSG